ncbi:MAG: hypothetical protein Q9204_003554 [Flavoplaca sp. TL-2023a]
MYSSSILNLLPLLSLPLSIFAAPAPAPTTLYQITAASVNLKPFSTPETLYVFKTLSVTVRGVNQGNFDIVCTGQAIVPVSEDAKLGSYKLDCPADPAGNVVVGTGVGPELTVSVQW